MKAKAVQGMLWSALDKFASQIGQFVFGIILARLLMPADYGLIGMLSIFLAISQSFIDSGMGSGLVQKKNRNDLDFSTVFVFNLVVSVSFYMILFASAPIIADFYNIPQLVLLTRVLSLNIVINSLSIVQRSRLTINIDFRTIAKVNVITQIIGGIVAIYFAYTGWGVWALVIRTIIGAIVSVILFWFFSKWKPSIIFSKESFKNLFGFGSKLLLAGLYAQVFNNIYNMVIGKAYTASELGYYERAKGYAELISITATNILLQVAFPVLASLQDEKERLVSVYSRIIKMVAFVIFPMMTLLALLADPLVRLLLTEKWAPLIVLLQWMCFARIFTPISVVNMTILKAISRSDLFLKVDLSKLPLAVLALVITIPMGVKAMVIGHVVTSGIAFFINAYMPGKLFGYGAINQLRDLTPVIIATGLMAFAVFVFTSLTDQLFLKIILGFTASLSSYLLASHLLRIKELDEFKTLALSIFRKDGL